MTTAITVETFTCDTCPAKGGEDDFTAYLDGRTDGDQLCDDCHREQAALRQSDRANADAYYCR